MLNPLLVAMLRRSKRLRVAPVKSIVWGMSARGQNDGYAGPPYSLAPSALPSAIQAVAVAARAVSADCCAPSAASVASSA